MHDLLNNCLMINKQGAQAEFLLINNYAKSHNIEWEPCEHSYSFTIFLRFYRIVMKSNITYLLFRIYTYKYIPFLFMEVYSHKIV